MVKVEKFINSIGEITKCTPSESSSEIYIEGSGFEPDKMVSVLVTNPGYNIEDTAEFVDTDRIQYASTVKADCNGNISFVFNTIVKGNDMPGEYKVYLSDENGNSYAETFMYGTIEIGEITAKDLLGNVITDISSYSNVIFSCKCTNRSLKQIKPAVVTAFYNKGTLEAVSKSDDSVINPESVQELSWEVAIPENISDISDVKVIFMDSVITLKPLTTYRIIYSRGEE